MRNDALDRLKDWGADTAVVLGSGLSSLVEAASDEARIPFADFAELPRPTVPGHVGQFVLGKVAEKRVIYAQGRVHLYEGRTPQEVTAGIRLLSAAGIQRVILTNAAGAANPAFTPGSWMMIADQLNLTATSPLLGAPQFADMTEIYSAGWRAVFLRAAAQAGIVLHEGVYAGLLGPQYETPAEVRMLRQLGADAIGMSTVLEAIQARSLGLEIAGFSCLTNLAAGLSPQHLSHDEVLATGKAAAQDFARLLEATFAAA